MDKEKLNTGLECCIVCAKTHVCPAGCPYAMDEGVADGLTVHCDGMLLMDAQLRIRELEAAQTARVMTLEELENALDTVVWVEEPEFENFADHYALIMAYSHKVGFVRVSFGFAEMPVDCEYEYEDYGKKWRCWTQRPTDKQRKATQWAK